MGSWSEQQEANKERKEKDKTRRDKLAGYFFQPFPTDFCCIGIRWCNSTIH